MTDYDFEDEECENEDIEVCPVCGSYSISYLDNDRSSSTFRENWICNDCDAEWDIVFNSPVIENVVALQK